MPQAPGYGATGQVKAMFVVSLDAILDKLNTSTSWYYIPTKYDPLLAVLRRDDATMHPVYSRLMESLEHDRRQAKAEGKTTAYYWLAALELVAKVVLEQPIERLPLGHEALSEAPQARSYMALVWAAQFLAYCEGKEPFSIYDENVPTRVWSIADDNVKAEDFYNYFRVEA